MLFILAMDPLQNLLDKAIETELLHPIGALPVRLRTSLYADGTTLFLRPIASDVAHLHHLLQAFGSATGLCTNVEKSEILPMHCEDIDVPVILGQFHTRLTPMPFTYL
jgi:hypothetical protein